MPANISVFLSSARHGEVTALDPILVSIETYFCIRCFLLQH